MHRTIVIAAVVAFLGASCATEGLREVRRAEPGPRLDPEEVVQIQLRALQLNDDENSGIAVAFRFASPANKEATGPLDRFTQLFLNPAYAPMLNHIDAEYGPLVVAGNQARQVVALTTKEGPRVAYLFALSKQTHGPFEGSWMTDAVSVVGITSRPANQLPRVPIPESL